MTAVIAITGSAPAADLAAAVARRLTGPTIVLPYDDLLRTWVAKPTGEALIRETTDKQIKLLVAGYVRAGFHVVLHGTLDGGAGAEDAGIRETLQLMRTVPRVGTLWVEWDERPRGAGDLQISPTTRSDAAATRVWERLPPEASNA